MIAGSVTAVMKLITAATRRVSSTSAIGGEMTVATCGK
jgi:hypothetical protein